MLLFYRDVCTVYIIKSIRTLAERSDLLPGIAAIYVTAALTKEMATISILSQYYHNQSCVHNRDDTQHHHQQDSQAGSSQSPQLCPEASSWRGGHPSSHCHGEQYSHNYNYGRATAINAQSGEALFIENLLVCWIPSLVLFPLLQPIRIGCRPAQFPCLHSTNCLLASLDIVIIILTQG